MPEVEVRGLRDFQRELRKAGGEFNNELRKINRKVSDLVAGRAKLGAQSGGAQASKAAKAVKARASNTSASIDIVRNPPFALAVFWGQRRRSGWYAKGRYADSVGKQFQPWVGNQWDPGDLGGRPYFIGDAINASLDEVEDIYLTGVDDVMRRAFPD